MRDMGDRAESGVVTGEEVFLTPRVLDQRAFEEMSSTLRGLVDEAANQSRALLGATGEVKSLGGALREATKELQLRVEAAGKAVPGLDDRVAKAESLLAKAMGELQAKAREVDELTRREVVVDRTRIEELVDQHLRVLVAERLQPLIEQRADAFLRGMVDRHESLRRDLELTLDRLRLGQSALDESVAKAEQSVRAIVERATGEASSAAGEALERSRERFESLEARGAERVREIGQMLKRDVDEAGSRAQGMIGAIEDRAREAAAAADAASAAFERLDQRELARSIDRAREVAGEVEGSLERAEGVAALLNQSGTILARAEQGCRDLGSLAEQAEVARRHLADAVLNAADRIDALERRAEDLARAQGHLREAMGEASSRAQGLERALEGMDERVRATLEGVIEPTVDRATRDAREVGGRLAELVGEARTIGDALHRLIQGAPKA